MSPIYQNLTLPLSLNTTSPPPTISTVSPFAPILQILIFFIGTCIVPTMTAHHPIPLTLETLLGHTVIMILSPITSAIGAFHCLVIFGVKIVRGIMWRRSENVGHDAISAGAYAIRIPTRFEKQLEESPFGWRRLRKNVPLNEGQSNDGMIHEPSSISEDTILYSLPPLSRFRTKPPPIFPSSSKLKTSFAILQLGYSVAQVYLQYQPMIQSLGISSPFMIGIPYLYASFINLSANFVQGSYSHVTIIRSKKLASRMDGMEIQHRSVDDVSFNEWLRIYYPQIELIHPSDSLSTIAFLLHHLLFLALWILAIGLLTRFQTSQSPFLLLLIDPISQLLLATAQDRTCWSNCFCTALGSRTCVGMVMTVVWIVYIIGWVYAGRILFESYAG